MKSKRRKISAIRDFPPRCGRDSDKINGKPNEDFVVVGANNVKAKANNTTTVESAVIGTSQTLENSVQTVLAQKSVALDQPTKNVDLTESINLSKTLGLKVNVLSESGLRLADSQVRGKIFTRNYPPRTKVSAIRDFPHGFERNSAPFVRDDCLKAAASSGNGSLGDRMSSAKNRVSEGIVKADVKEIRYEDLEGSDLEEKFKQLDPMEAENKFRVKYGDIHNERIDFLVGTSPQGDFKQEDEKVQSGIYSGSRLKEGNTKQFRDKHPHKSNLSQPGPNLCMNFEKLLEMKEVKMEKGSTKHCNTKSVKRDFLRKSEYGIGSSNKFQKEDSMGLKSPDGREVVLALRAAPFCPWRKGRRRASKSNLTTGTESNIGKGHENKGKGIAEPSSIKRRMKRPME